VVSQPNISEDIRKRANEHFKVVDQLIKSLNLEKAVEELSKAKAIDPQNGYIKAFEERIAFLTDEGSRQKRVEATRKQMEAEARKKFEIERVRIEEERKKKEQEIVKKVHAAHEQKIPPQVGKESGAAPSTPAQPAPAGDGANKVNEDRKRIEAESKRNFEAEFRKEEEMNRLNSAVNSPPKIVMPPSSPTDPLEMYKRVLLLAWADGALSLEEQAQLSDLRSSLSILPQEHETLELEARQESYFHAFKLIWTSGLKASERSSVIAELRKRFQLSPEDHSKLESKILGELAPSETEAMIYVVDDEDEFLSVLVHVLENADFRVKAFNTSDDALIALQTESPSLIISDISLETSSSGGFAFYEKIRQMDHLLNVPFIFLSGMSDEGMIRYGKGLGADDYLTKPISNDTLLDTIKGKLKRFKALKRVRG